jgi:hypothetical protein
MHQTKRIDFWIVREGEDPYEVAPKAAGALAEEILEPRNKVCLFCPNKAQSVAVIAFRLHEPGADIYTTSICEDCARMSDEQLAEKTRQEAMTMEKRRRGIRAAMQEMIDSGELVPTGEMRRNPTTGEMRPVYRLKKFANKKH